MGILATYRAAFIAALIGVGIVLVIIAASLGKTSETVFPALESACNVQGYTLYGDLVTTSAYSGMGMAIDDEGNFESAGSYTLSDDIVTGIEEAGENEDVKAIVIEIDSWGGQAVAGEEIANALMRAEKPTVVLIRSAGLSAAYWAATGADRIYASQNSDVGSIGVALTYLDEAGKNEKEGINYNSVVSGKYKDMGSPHKTLTADERSLLQRDIDIIHTNFVKAVSTNRNLSEEEVRVLADGSTLMGEMALAAGLIDKIGDISSVREYLAEQIGEDVEICWNEYE